MQKRNRPDKPGVPPELLRSAPRQVRPNAAGVIVLAVAIGLVIAAGLAGPALYSRVKASERTIGLAASESVTSTAEVTRVQRRGGGNDRRSVVHYRYVANGQEHDDSTTVRRQDRDRYEAGSRVPIRYLASEPESSWMEGYGPGPRPVWPAFALPVALIVAAFVIARLFLGQLQLLAYGRPALALVTKVEKKRSDKGSFWRVHFEWTLLSGAKRTGHYNDSKKQTPAIGTPIPIVYDRDNPQRIRKYPFGLVELKGK